MLTDDDIPALFQREQEAKDILGDERVMGGLRRMSERLIADWRNAARSAPTLRDELHAQVAAIDALVSLWQRDISDAEFLRAKQAKAAKR